MKSNTKSIVNAVKSGSQKVRDNFEFAVNYNMTQIVDKNKKARLLQIIELPVPWFGLHIQDYMRASQNKDTTMISVRRNCLKALVFANREYIDQIIRNISALETSQISYIYSEVGWTLCNLKYFDEGIKYLELAYEKEVDEQKQFSLALMLSWRLNSARTWPKRHALATQLITKYPDNANVALVLAKDYITQCKFEDASIIVDNLPDEYRFMWAEIYFAQQKYGVAKSNFEKFKMPDSLFFWKFEHDYKKALAYYFSGDLVNCRKQAFKIKYRISWDKFYCFSDLEEMGIKREPFIENIINSQKSNGIYIDTDRITRCTRNLGYIVWGWLRVRPYLITVILIVLLFLLFCWLFPGRRFHWHRNTA
ncbi:MAG: hypothetical protein A2Y07_01170 [Planctomycetes bacterium GWF2_50_10]|nr:MAG: hypothetical protein A2Y07_01170 [Planctomycetes bacterium GWF2_50_10]